MLSLLDKDIAHACSSDVAMANLRRDAARSLTRYPPLIMNDEDRSITRCSDSPGLVSIANYAECKHAAHMYNATFDQDVVLHPGQIASRPLSECRMSVYGGRKVVQWMVSHYFCECDETGHCASIASNYLEPGSWTRGSWIKIEKCIE